MTLPKKLLSIDIGNEWIKIAYVQRKGKKMYFLKGIKVATPAGCVYDGNLSNTSEIAGVIRSAIEQEQIKEKQVVFSIASSKIITREVELPNLSAAKLANIIDLNADDYFPVNLAEYCVDYTVTEVIDSDEGKKAKVIVVAALKKLIQSYVDLAQMCQLEVVGTDYSGSSIVNYIRHEQYEGTNLFLNIGPESTMVTIVSNNVVKFSRNVLFGTKAIYETIASHFDVSYDEAIKIAKERQLLNPDQNENAYIHNDVTSGMEQILNGVARLIDYYSSRNQYPIEQVYIMDGGSEIYGVEDYIGRFFGLKVKKISGLRNYIFNEDQVKFEDIHYYPIALGATLSTMNLLPVSIKNKDELQAKKRIPILIGLLLLVSLGAHYYTGYAEYQSLQREKIRIESDIVGMQDIYEVIDLHAMALKEADFRKVIDMSTRTKSDEFLQLIDEFEQTMPDQAFFTSVTVSDLSADMNATFKDEASLAQMLTYLKSLETSNLDGDIQPMFEKVYIPSVNRVGDVDDANSYVTVTIQCTYTQEEVDADDQ